MEERNFSLVMEIQPTIDMLSAQNRNFDNILPFCSNLKISDIVLGASILSRFVANNISIY